MSKIKWKSKSETDAEKTETEKFKGRDFKKLSDSEKDEILEIIAKKLGII